MNVCVCVTYKHIQRILALCTEKSWKSDNTKHSDPSS